MVYCERQQCTVTDNHVQGETTLYSERQYCSAGCNSVVWVATVCNGRQLCTIGGTVYSEIQQCAVNDAFPVHHEQPQCYGFITWTAEILYITAKMMYNFLRLM